MDFDFVFYGAGISAKIAAVSLLKEGFKVCIIQDKKKFSKNSNLVTFLSEGSINYLTTLVSNPANINNYTTIQKLNCSLTNSTGSKEEFIEFTDNKSNSLGKIIPNNILEGMFDEELSKLKNITIIKDETPIKINDASMNVEIFMESKNSIRAKVFILSSSNNHEMNRNLNIKFFSHDFNQIALSIKVIGQGQSEGCAYQKFSSDGPIAFLPYEKNEASIVWSVRDDSPFVSMNKSDLEKIINKKLNNFCQPLEIVDIEKHKLKFSFSRKLYSNKTVLIGNIAHNIHPIAGQGLNLSIKDISLFVKLVKNYKSIGYEINSSFIFEDYDVERKVDNTVYSFGTLALEEILSTQNKLVNAVSRKGISYLQKNNFMKKLFVGSATGKKYFNSL